MEPTTPIPSAEGPALESLKSKINDLSLPTLDLARALQAHLDIYPQSQRTFADKLAMPKKRSYLTEVIGLLKLPEAGLAAMRGKVLTRRVIREAVDHDVDHVDQSVDQGVDQPISGKDHVYSSKERLNSFNEGFPLLKDTINTVSRLVFIWAKDASLGDLAERWVLKFTSGDSPYSRLKRTSRDCPRKLRIAFCWWRVNSQVISLLQYGL